MPSPIIQTDNLIKWYGPRLAVQNVSFTVGQGEIVGLLGPNGSGKSTIFRILTGFIAPSSGTARVAGHDAALDALALRRNVGYVPEDAPLYDGMRVAEFLRFMARLKGLSGSMLNRRIDAVADQLLLVKVMDLPVSKLSRGYRQRVSIAQALLNEPEILVFDEPTSGLDPSQVIAVRDLIRELAGKQTVLIASHVLPEIQQIANRVMILLEGKLLTTDALARSAHFQHLRLDVAGTDQQVRSAIGSVPGVRSVSAGQRLDAGLVRYLVEGDQRPRLAQDISEALFNNRLGLAELVAVRPDLERVYLDLTRPPQDAAA
jgi:ABC-2 type transport system ATP-binding protein